MVLDGTDSEDRSDQPSSVGILACADILDHIEILPHLECEAAYQNNTTQSVFQFYIIMLV